MRLTERFFGISKTITRSLFGKPATLMYPQRPRAFPAATRGRVGNEIERCIFCRMCERNCPTDAIGVSKEKNEWEIDSLKCCTCRRCVEVCPVKCLSMDNVYFSSVRTRAEGKYLRVLPAGVVPAYEKAKQAKAGKQVTSEAPAAESGARKSEKEKEEQG
jgi:ech hydrogenase subunit F